ncbi:DUF2299 family protein [Chloroflexota bacterium]
MDISIRNKIYQWVREGNIFQGEYEEKGNIFHIKVTAPGKSTITPETIDLSTVDIQQSEQDNDMITVSAGVQFDKEFINPIQSFNNADEVIFELNMALESRPESYFIDYDDDGVLKSIVVVEEIYFDGLTKDRLFRAIRGVNKSIILALWVLRPLIDSLGIDTEKLIFDDETAEEAKETDDSHIVIDESFIAGFCPVCGKENKKKAKFCTKCGASLEEES